MGRWYQNEKEARQRWPVRLFSLVQLSMRVESEVPINPDYKKCLSIAIPHDWGHTMETKGNDVGVAHYLCRYGPDEHIFIDFFVPTTVSWGQLELPPCLLAHLMQLVSKSCFLLLIAFRNAILSIYVLQAKEGNKVIGRH